MSYIFPYFKIFSLKPFKRKLETQNPHSALTPFFLSREFQSHSPEDCCTPDSGSKELPLLLRQSQESPLIKANASRNHSFETFLISIVRRGGWRRNNCTPAISDCVWRGWLIGARWSLPVPGRPGFPAAIFHMILSDPFHAATEPF